MMDLIKDIYTYNRVGDNRLDGIHYIFRDFIFKLQGLTKLDSDGDVCILDVQLTGEWIDYAPDTTHMNWFIVHEHEITVIDESKIDLILL
jgi:hypothetical protein